jgi:hypothetical protein
MKSCARCGLGRLFSTNIFIEIIRNSLVYEAIGITSAVAEAAAREEVCSISSFSYQISTLH